MSSKSDLKAAFSKQFKLAVHANKMRMALEAIAEIEQSKIAPDYDILGLAKIALEEVK